jgi:hypothetical protein
VPPPPARPQCTPNGDHFEGYCQSCDGDNPSWCTKCRDQEGGRGMFTDYFGACQFCAEGCLKCYNKSGYCKECDTQNGWTKNEFGSCDKVAD